VRCFFEGIAALMPTSTDDIAHLLRRAAFGGTVAEIQVLAALDLPAAVDRVLSPANVPPDTTPAGMFDPALPDGDKRSNMLHHWMARMADPRSAATEKMTMFWHGHFVSGIDKAIITQMNVQIAGYRRLALGNFVDLTHQMALDPGMMVYLDNASNTQFGAQQNFARELMELFTLGVGNYSENEVVDVARAWTGHTINQAHDAYVFRPDWHDNGPKTIFGTTKNWDGPAVIDEIFANARTKAVAARFIATKLWTWHASQNPPVNVIDALANEFIASNWSIRALCRAMYLRPEFYATKFAQVRTPTEYVVALIRATGVPASELHPEFADAAMGQVLMAPPNVSGWRPNLSWVNPSALGARANLALQLHWKLEALGRHPLANTSSLAADPAVSQVAALYGITLSTGSRQALRQFVDRARASTSPWTERLLLVLAALTPEFQCN
jgi:uncharacterized protein (DUF1800 family)